MKRYQKPRLKPGRITVQYGKIEHNDPDLIFSWGPGCSRADAHYLHHVFSDERFGPSGERYRSLVDELEARGYDITTLRFSIEKPASPVHSLHTTPSSCAEKAED